MINYFKKIDGVLYFILFLCLVGFLRNILYLFNYGFDYGNLPTTVFIAMVVIYGAQAVLILMRERKAWIISAIQVFFCFYVYEDYTFLPFGHGINVIVGSFAGNLDYGWAKFLSTIIASGLFCFELLKTYLIYALTDEPRHRRKPKAVTEREATAA